MWKPGKEAAEGSKAKLGWAELSLIGLAEMLLNSTHFAGHLQLDNLKIFVYSPSCIKFPDLHG